MTDDSISFDDLKSASSPLTEGVLGAKECIAKFLRFFPAGFRDPAYLSTERNYKVAAHQEWVKLLNVGAFKMLLRTHRYHDIVNRFVSLEGKTHLLYSFDKIALRDALKSFARAQQFSLGLFEFIYGESPLQTRFENWIATIRELPKIKSKVFSWPVVTIAGFVADPTQHIYLKPEVTKKAAEVYGYSFEYSTVPNWETYKSLLGFVEELKAQLTALEPRDMIDFQSFIWVLGSDEYKE